jgi:hypothetical protein
MTKEAEKFSLQMALRRQAIGILDDHFEANAQVAISDAWPVRQGSSIVAQLRQQRDDIRPSMRHIPSPR